MNINAEHTHMTFAMGQLSGYQNWTRAAGGSKETLRVRLCVLKRLAGSYEPIPLTALTTDQLTAYMAQPGWRPETRKAIRAAICSFYRWATEMEIITRDPSRRLPKVRVPAGLPKPTPEAVYAKALLKADARGQLLLILASFTGLRRAEIARVHTDHIEGTELRVEGKGGKVRMIPLHPLLQAELSRAPRGFLFPGQEDGHLSPGYVGVLFRRMLGSGYSAHSLRHRFATRAYAGERDLLAVQQLLGHSKPETTRRYTQVPDGALAAAVLAVG